MFSHMFTVSRLKETWLDEWAKFWAPRSVLVTGFYAARYIVGMFVTGILNEAH
jgi:hypothetical protein